MIDEKIDKKEAVELKKVHNHYIDKGSEIMRDIQFELEDVFGDVVSKASISPEQIRKLHVFFG